MDAPQPLSKLRMWMPVLVVIGVLAVALVVWCFFGALRLAVEN